MAWNTLLTATDGIINIKNEKIWSNGELLLTVLSIITTFKRQFYAKKVIYVKRKLFHYSETLIMKAVVFVAGVFVAQNVRYEALVICFKFRTSYRDVITILRKKYNYSHLAHKKRKKTSTTPCCSQPIPEQSHRWI